jgi:hypothetical protein
VGFKVLRRKWCRDMMSSIRMCEGAMSEIPPPNGSDVLADMEAWRAAHPTATLAEIEAALDQRLMALRRQMLADTIAQSDQANWAQHPPA